MRNNPKCFSIRGVKVISKKFTNPSSLIMKLQITLHASQASDAKYQSQKLPQDIKICSREGTQNLGSENQRYRRDGVTPPPVTNIPSFNLFSFPSRSSSLQHWRLFIFGTLFLIESFVFILFLLAEAVKTLFKVRLTPPNSPFYSFLYLNRFFPFSLFL